MTDVVSLIRKRDLSFRVFKYSFLTELFVWQNKNAVLFNKEDNFALMKLKLAAILFFSSLGEVLEMVYYHFINSLRASRCTKSETLSKFRTDEKLGILNQMFWSENEKMFYKRTTLPQTNCSRRT